MMSDSGAGQVALRHDDRFLRTEYRKVLFPIMLSVLGGTVNALIDSVFVSRRIGVDGLAAVNLSMPVYLALCVLGSLVATLAVVLPSFIIILLVTALLKTVLKNKYVQAVLRGLKPCMIGIILATGVYMIFRNGIVLQDSVVLIRPLILTLVLGTVYFGSRKIKKGGISPILLLGISAAAGIAAYGL